MHLRLYQIKQYQFILIRYRHTVGRLTGPKLPLCYLKREIPASDIVFGFEIIKHRAANRFQILDFFQCYYFIHLSLASAFI